MGKKIGFAEEIWTNRQVERMNRTLKEATIRRSHYENHVQLRQHLTGFVTAYNDARRLKIIAKGIAFERVL